MNYSVNVTEVREDVINMSNISFRVLDPPYIQHLRLSVFNQVQRVNVIS